MVWNKRKIKSSDADTPPPSKRLKLENTDSASPAEDNKTVVDEARHSVHRSSSSSSFEPTSGSPQLRMPRIKPTDGADETSFVTALEVQINF